MPGDIDHPDLSVFQFTREPVSTQPMKNCQAGFWYRVFATAVEIDECVLGIQVVIQPTIELITDPQALCLSDDWIRCQKRVGDGCDKSRFGCCAHSIR